MSDFGKRLRLNRIFRGPHRKALIVAFDHAIVLGPIPGTTDPSDQIKQFASGGADAVLLNFGILRRCIDSFLHPSAPAVILRLDWTSAWHATDGTRKDGKLSSKLLAAPEEALRNGADAVLTYLFVGTGDAEFEGEEVARNASVARECERLGLPLIIETIARGRRVRNPVALEWMKFHTRVAAELGADLIKTEYTGKTQSMRSVVESCPIPILVLGGARWGSDRDSLEVVRGSAEAGAAGVFFGRSVFQSTNILDFLRRARHILDEYMVTERAAPLKKSKK